MLTEVRVRNPNRPTEPQLSLPLYGPSKFPIVFLEGLNPVGAEFSSSPYANLPGEHLQSSRVTPRNIIVTLELKPDHYLGEDVEDLRRQLVKYFLPGERVDFDFVTDKVTRHIFGTVETVEAPMFVREPQVQISVICHDPYFKDTGALGSVEFTQTLLPNATWTVQNDGDVSVGFKLSIDIQAAMTGLEMSVTPKANGMFVFDAPVLSAQQIVIDSRPFQKSIRNNGTGENLMSKIRRGSTWQMLAPGENQITVAPLNSATVPNIYTITFERSYTSL